MSEKRRIVLEFWKASQIVFNQFEGVKKLSREKGGVQLLKGRRSCVTSVERFLHDNIIKKYCPVLKKILITS